MAGGVPEVQESAFREDDDTVVVFKDPSVDLGLDVDFGDWEFLETLEVDLVVEVTDVSDNSVVLHLSHVGGSDNVFVSGTSDEHVNIMDHLFDSDNFVPLHTSLESTDRVDLRDKDSGPGSLHSRGTSFADISITEDQHLLSSKHNIGSSVDSIRQRVFAAIDVVKLGFGD